MSIKELLLEILKHESSEEAKLDILTDIGLGTTNDEVFKATEEVREHISNQTNNKAQVGTASKRKDVSGTNSEGMLGNTGEGDK